MFLKVILLLFTLHQASCILSTEDLFNWSQESFYFSWNHNSNSLTKNNPDSSAGDPLFLTPYLETNKEEDIKKAREAASVKPFVGNIVSYSGYFTVNKKFESNLFFWFFKNENNVTNAPLLLWLHGGPGHSSLMGLFEENGPYRINEDKKVELAEISWTKDYNVLYVDNPVGAGYSFTKSVAGYSKTVQDATNNLYNFLIQFFKLFSEYQKNPFYLTGQSYGGKFISNLAAHIREKNNDKDVKIKINLKGLFIGCGYIDPQNQLRYADYLYENGVVDSKIRRLLTASESGARNAILAKKPHVAAALLSVVGVQMFRAGYKPPFIDVANPTYDLSSYKSVTDFITKTTTRKAIHVGSQKFDDKAKVVFHFRDDFFSSVSQHLTTALKNYDVLLYSGQFDMIIPPTQIENVISSLSWNNVQKFIKTKRTKWMVDGEDAGYMKTYSNLTQVLVREANHLIIRCQQKRMLSLLKYFILKSE